MSIDPFRRLVKLVARAFYDEEIPPKEPNRSKSDKSDNRGIAVVVLDALTRRQWVKEEDLARDLKLHPKQLRRTLRVLQHELLIVRENHRETVRSAKVYNAAIAAVGEQSSEREGEEKSKLHTHSYWCLDYAQVYDVVRYRIHRAKKKIKDELDDRNPIQEYICPSPTCGRRFSALDALALLSSDGSFHCEICSSELVAESDKIAAAELGDGDGEDNARRRRREKLKELDEKLERQLKPLLDQLAKVKDLPPPDFGSLEAWEKRVIAAGRVPNGEASSSDMGRPSGQGTSGTAMPFLGETKVEVALGTEAKLEEDKEDNAPMKVLPPWMIREGMQLTASQRGEQQSSDMKMDMGEASAGTGGAEMRDVKPAIDPMEDKEETKRKIQEEYLKAYYAALMARQQQTQLPETPAEPAAEAREVGVKSKREGDDDEEEIEWEDAGAPEGEEAAPSQESHFVGSSAPDTAGAEDFDDDNDDVDWEEG